MAELSEQLPRIPPWLPYWDPIPPWIIDDKIRQKFMQLEIQFRMKELDIQKERLQAISKLSGIG